MKKTVLIIDDEPEIVELLTDFIRQAGHEIISANNGLQGLEAAIKHKPDLIISDVNMPKMNGLEMLEKLKSAGCTTPVILFTAYSDTQKIKTAWKLGAFDFVEKPIDFSALNKIIDKALQFGSVFRDNVKSSKLFQSNPDATVELQIKLPILLHEKLQMQANDEKSDLQAFILKKLAT